jgi:hypothetical protein
VHRHAPRPGFHRVVNAPSPATDIKRRPKQLSMNIERNIRSHIFNPRRKNAQAQNDLALKKP